MEELELQAHIADLLPARSGEPIVDIAYLEGGYSNRNFAFTLGDERLVLRLPERAQPFVDRLHEQDFIAQLPPALGPDCLALDVASGRMLSRWVDGPLLVDVAATLTPDDLINYLQQLHRVLPDPQRIYDVNTLVVEYSGGEKQHAFTRSTHSKACHNDLNPWNIIVSPSGWVTLDWEFVGHNDPLFDLVALQQGLERPEHELPELALALAGDTPALIERLNTAYLQFWRREAAWAHYQIQQGNDRMEIKQQIADARNKIKTFVPFQSP